MAKRKKAAKAPKTVKVKVSALRAVYNAGKRRKPITIKGHR